MKRFHALEFEDLENFPSWLRTCMTNLIVVLARKLQVPEVLGAKIAEVLAEQQLDQVVDLGSGGGGSMPDILAELRAKPEFAEARLVMTDRYPNAHALERFNQADAPHLRYEREPVDATDLASAPPGLKTMVNCFHHMRPEQAKAILASAQRTRQPILIYEMGNNVPRWLWLLTMPLALPMIGLMTWFLTPMVRPLTGRQLLFTYLIPIIPFFYAWDGHASSPRIYTLEDYDELTGSLDDAPDYAWERGPAPNRTGQGTYLLGRPV